MRGAVLGILASAAIAFGSTAANAALSISVTPGTPVYSGPAPTYNFDPGSRPGGATTGNYQNTSLTDTYAQPFGGTGYYYEVGPGTSTPGIIDLTSFGNIYDIFFIWGSVDTYNTLQILDGSMSVLYTLVGNDIFNPANGNQTSPNTNPLVVLNFSGSDIANVSYLKFNSTVNAFEIDNLGISVPEPGTWGLMLLGFAGIGMALRRRRRPALAQVA